MKIESDEQFQEILILMIAEISNMCRSSFAA